MDHGLSIVKEQKNIIIDTIKNITRGDWKVLVVDETTKKIIDNVAREDDILNNNIANIERIEDKREPNPTMDAIYLLSPQPHIVDCLLADFDRRRYRKAFLVWTGALGPELKNRLSPQHPIAGFEILLLDYYPRESHLITFRDPWSFPVLYHPACNDLVRTHMQSLAEKIAAVCITLGEFPKVRFYQPRSPTHEASVLSWHLARFVQQELDDYKQWNPNFPPPTSRPQGVLVITDRSMDLMAPLLHEFTYQAMAHDLLPIKDGEKTTFGMIINEGTPMAEEKEMELAEKDKVWVENRHRHMKDTIEKLMGDFQKFIDQNPNFTDENKNTTSLNAIKDMLAGLPQFQEMKEAYSLHLSMAQESMNLFQRHKLPDIASIEQTLATGLDEDLKKPKNVLDQVVRLLDDEAVTPSDRLRLILIYLLYRPDGVIMEDIKRLLAHASLPTTDGEIVTNLELLGAQPTRRALKDARPPPPPPLFPKNPKNAIQNEEYALSRFEPAVKQMLEALCTGTLDPTVFPYTNPPLDPSEEANLAAQSSLRAAAPRWAQANRRQVENRQRIIVFMAGGATYSEARSCYDVSEKQSRDVFLVTSHMLTPQFFLRQVGDLSVDRRRLDLPMDRPKPRAPAHLFERPAAPPPPMPAAGPAAPGMGRGGRAAGAGIPTAGPGKGAVGVGGGGAVAPRPPPTQGLAAMTLNSSSSSGGQRPTSSQGSMNNAGDGSEGKLPKEKKKRNIFGLKK
ncbi:Sec1 family protein [Diplogelasinospora grovesii]|uniref:Sec1 family protein n=1 Tax=Diplogelasinospora grovesii TaxID=303347 RepID=A0AAN6S0X3_9PEZI|nr:Sec1 family protein [Diplogelasinospora grovesii]